MGMTFSFAVNFNFNFNFRDGSQANLKNISIIRVDNEGQADSTLELKTPGGVFSLGTQVIAAGEVGDIPVIKAVYDIHVFSNGRTVSISNVDATDAIEVAVGKVLANDFSGIPTDSSFKPIAADARAIDYISADILEDASQVEAIPDDIKLADVLTKIRISGEEKVREQVRVVASAKATI